MICVLCIDWVNAYIWPVGVHVCPVFVVVGLESPFGVLISNGDLCGELQGSTL